MKQYKSVEIRVDAMKLSADNVNEVAAWCGGQMVTEKDAVDSSSTFVALNIPTLDGVKRVSEGMYVVKSEHGNFRVMSRYMFEREFQEV